MISTELPPGPSNKLLNTALLIRNPIPTLRNWFQQYGPTFTVPMLGEPAVMTADPTLVGDIYAVRDPDLFRAVLPEPAEVLLGNRSVLALSGEKHRRERKLLQPTFHGHRLEKWASVIVEAGRRAFHARGDRHIRALVTSEEAAIEIIIRVIFGVEDEDRIQEFIHAIRTWTGAVRPSFVFTRLMQRRFFGLTPFDRFMKISDHFDRMLYRQIELKRSSSSSGDDVLATMIGARYDDGSTMDDKSIRDELRTLLFAGHETSATTLAWALYYVHRTPGIRSRLLQELDTVDADGDPAALAKLPYLGAVVDEALRIRPVVAENYRRLAKPWQLGKWSLPAGITVSPAVSLIHHREDLWPEPEEFRPERFLRSSPPPPTHYLPFGGGAHRCLGAGFARFEASVLLGVLLKELEFELLDRDVQWGRGRVTLEPLGGIPMVVKPRSHA